MTTVHTTTGGDPRDVARQLAGQGVSNREIARRTGVSETTVRRWRRDDAATHDVLAIPLDDDLRADLAIMAAAGLAPVDAVYAALSIVAGTYANAWSAGVVPPGHRPVITDCSVRPHT